MTVVTLSISSRRSTLGPHLEVQHRLWDPRGVSGQLLLGPKSLCTAPSKSLDSIRRLVTPPRALNPLKTAADDSRHLPTSLFQAGEARSSFGAQRCFERAKPCWGCAGTKLLDLVIILRVMIANRYHLYNAYNHMFF